MADDGGDGCDGYGAGAKLRELRKLSGTAGFSLSRGRVY